MKKVFLVLCLTAFMASSLVSCTEEPTVETNELQTDKDKNCAPNDRNCNGVPDNEE